MEYGHPSKINWLWAVVILILALVACALIYFFYFKNLNTGTALEGEIQETEMGENDEFSGWETYSNQEYDFEFRYPGASMHIINMPLNDYCFDGSEFGNIDCTNYAAQITDHMDFDGQQVEIYNGMQVMVVHHGLTEDDIHKYDVLPRIGENVDVTTKFTVGNRQAYKYNLVSATGYKVQGFIVYLDDDNYLEIYENAKYPKVTDEEWVKIINSFKFI